MVLSVKHESSFGAGSTATVSLITQKLSDKGFAFILKDEDVEKYAGGLTKYESQMGNIANRLTWFLVGADPEIGSVSKYFNKVFSLGIESSSHENIASVCQKMIASFNFNAVKFGMLSGGSAYITLVNADPLSEGEIRESIERFTNINMERLTLGGTTQMKVLGRKLINLGQSSVTTGSICFLVSTSEKEALLRRVVASIDMHSDTILNQMKEIFSDWKTWVGMAFGFVTYKPFQLRQEAIIYNTVTNILESNIHPRIPFEFGFSLEDIKL
jgi:hypothetical protein